MPKIESGLNHEQQILDTIKKIEVPFMMALQRTFGAERGWRCCGPASIALSRILSYLTGVPIGRSLEGEHIELTVGIFDPKKDINRLSRIEEQTHIRYHVGNEFIYYIDAIYGLLMLARPQLEKTIQVEKYHAGTIDPELIARHNLYPFDPNHKGIAGRGMWGQCGTPEECRKTWEDIVEALNDERGTCFSFKSDCGERVYHPGWNEVVPVIEEICQMA